MAEVGDERLAGRRGRTARARTSNRTSSLRLVRACAAPANEFGPKNSVKTLMLLEGCGKRALSRKTRSRPSASVARKRPRRPRGQGVRRRTARTPAGSEVELDRGGCRRRASRNRGPSPSAGWCRRTSRKRCSGRRGSRWRRGSWGSAARPCPHKVSDRWRPCLSARRTKMHQLLPLHLVEALRSRKFEQADDSRKARRPTWRPVGCSTGLWRCAKVSLIPNSGFLAVQPKRQTFRTYARK